MKRPGLLVAGAAAAVVVFLVYRKRAAASSSARAPGFGQPGFVQNADPTRPATVIGCSFVRAGGQLLDANTGKVISEAEAQRRAAAEGCTVPPPPTKTKQSSVFNSGVGK